MPIGKIVRINAGFYDLITSDGQVFRVRGAGIMRLGEAPLVGDQAEFTINGMLTALLPRRNELTRPKVANVDYALIVSALTNPTFSSLLLHKMLAAVEWAEITPILVFTKADLLTVPSSWPGVFARQNYSVFTVRPHDEEVFTALRAKLIGKLTVFAGQTGAGKSSLINALLRSELQKTQEISKALGRGKHTTRLAEIILVNGLQLIDTPGFSSFELPLDPLDLAQAYYDFRPPFARCKFFPSCLHLHESVNDCAVKARAQNDVDFKIRYDDYVKMLLKVYDGHPAQKY